MKDFLYLQESKSPKKAIALIKDDSILDYEDLPNPIDCTEEMIADLSEAQALLSEVVNELKSLENGEA